MRDDDNRAVIQQGSRVLISSNRPTPGGVQVMLKFVIDCLKQRGCLVTVAYYQPYSVSPQLSVPLHSLFSRRPRRIEDHFHNQPCVGIGCWLPELEITHYRSSALWEQLIEEHDIHLAVGGSCQPAFVYLQNKVPFLAWVASDWQGDRHHRVQTMPLLRRLVDRLFITPIAKRMEKQIVASNSLVALSDSTLKALNAVTGEENVDRVLPIAIDTGHFKPYLMEQAERRQEARESEVLTIGFVGRFEDPRKNITLLFDVFADLLKTEKQLRLRLIGDELTQQSRDYLASLGITDQIDIIPHVEQADLPRQLNKMDVFVLPSYQEGLCIAALEAMSCGVPVVSTRCGGPETFIDHGVNGLLCEHEASALSAAVLQLLSDDVLRMRYASAARKTVVNQFSEPAQMTKFWALLDQFPQPDKITK